MFFLSNSLNRSSLVKTGLEFNIRAQSFIIHYKKREINYETQNFYLSELFPVCYHLRLQQREQFCSTEGDHTRRTNHCKQ
jgi:hypothetical protein